MRKTIFSILVLAGIMISSGGFFFSCSNSAHCPGVASTGNSSAMKGGGGGGGHCAGTTSTGNWKPRKTHIKQDGLTSKKMERSIQKHSNSQATSTQE